MTMVRIASARSAIAVPPSPMVIVFLTAAACAMIFPLQPGGPDLNPRQYAGRPGTSLPTSSAQPMGQADAWHVDPHQWEQAGERKTAVSGPLFCIQFARLRQNT